MGSRRIALNRLTPSQNRLILLIQVVLFLLGVLLLVIGGLRIAIEFSETLFNVDSEQLKEGISGWVTGDTYTSPLVLMISIVAAVVGYSMIWSSMAIGAKEPPAWSAGRNSLIISIISLVLLAAVAILIDAPFLPFILGGIVILTILELWLVVRWIQHDFRLALGAERIQQRTRSRWVWVLYGLLVVSASTLGALGLVYAVFTDVIELPVADTPSGELIYITTFDGFNDEWILSEDDTTRAEITILNDGQQLVLFKQGVETASQVDDGQILFSLLDRKLNNYDLSVTTTQLASDEFHDNLYGVMVGYRGEDELYYLFQISGDGYYRLVKIIPGVDNDEIISDWIDTTNRNVDPDPMTGNYPTLIRPGRSNTIQNPIDARNEIRVVVSDQSFSFFVNGEPLPLCLKGSRQRSMWFNGTCVEGNIQSYTYQDDDYRQGQVGVFIGRTPSSDPLADVSVAFDNIIIVGSPTDLVTPIE